MKVKSQKLVSISEYARYYSINRKTVYALLEKGVITRFEDKKGNPLVSLGERPKGVKSYKGYRERKIK